MTADLNGRETVNDPVIRDSLRWKELGWGDPTAMSAFMSVLRVQKRIVDNAHEALDQLSLSITDFAALVYLGLSPGHQQPLGKIAHRLMIGAGRCSYVIDHLETTGLVERHKHPDDKRTTLAVLTERGLDHLGEAIDRLNAANFGFGSVDGDTMQHLVDVLGTVRMVGGDVEDAASEDGSANELRGRT